MIFDVQGTLNRASEHRFMHGAEGKNVGGGNWMADRSAFSGRTGG